jgi:hypothetical protein
LDKEDPFAPTVARIRITNHNDFEIADRCDSILYRFPPGKPQDIPLDAAHHLFGFHLEATEDEQFRHCCKRFGWNTLDRVKAGEDVKFFGNLDIRPVTYQLVEVKDPTYVSKRGGPRPRKDIPETIAPGPSE